MGNNQTISIELLKKDDLTKLIECDYTVIRSDSQESGWKIQLTPHTNQIYDDMNICEKICDDMYTCEFAEQDGFATRLIPGHNNEYGFRIFMNNNSQATRRSHECGWFPCFLGRREVWPSHLITEEQREEWWKWIDFIFKDLNSEEESRKRRKSYSCPDCPQFPDCSGCSTTCFARPFDSSGNKLYS